MERVYGIVTKITYYDDARGFGIIKIKLDYKDKELAKFRTFLFSNVLTVLSSFDRMPIVDEEIEFIGEFETSKYGMQFKAKTFKRRNEQSKEGIVTYLSSDFFPGVGKATASKIYDEIGNDCLKKIIDDRSVLDSINISEKLKTIIYENLVINETKEKQLVDLLNLGITMRMSIRIIKTLGIKAYETVKTNPYQLIDLVEGIGFVRADGIALSMGIKKNSPLRLKSLIVYVLENYIYANGNSYLHLNELYIECIRMVNTDEVILNKDNYRDLIKELVDQERVIVDEENNIYDVKIYNDEYVIARKVYQYLQNDKNEYDIKLIPEALNKVMVANKIEYSDKQKEAIEKALIEPIIIITGGPGTGKSTIIKGIVDTYASLFTNSEIISEKILLAAPTGRASKRLKEVTKHNAMTIHKLLGYEGGNRFTVTPDDPIDAKLLIIDEFSMVDISLASLLFSVLLPDTKVVIVGDADQLPSVGPGNVLKDLISTKEITTIKLDKIHRQASDSSIISLAHSINHGVLPDDLVETKHDRTFIKSDDENMIKSLEIFVEKEINKGMDLVKDIQILIPTYKGEVGIDAVNYRLQDKFNPQVDEITYLGRRFRVNDKVIQLTNRTEKQVMNGDIGFILTIEKEKDKFTGLSVMFDFGSVDYDKEELEDLSLAYAISIHKSQGSEFPVVVIPFSFRYYMMLKRKLIYTAVTRAKKFLVMLGNFEAVRKGVVELEEERKTKLIDRVKEIFENPNKIADKKSAFSEIKEDLENISPYDFM